MKDKDKDEDEEIRTIGVSGTEYVAEAHPKREPKMFVEGNPARGGPWPYQENTIRAMADGAEHTVPDSYGRTITGRFYRGPEAMDLPPVRVELTIDTSKAMEAISRVQESIRAAFQMDLSKIEAHVTVHQISWPWSLPAARPLTGPFRNLATMATERRRNVYGGVVLSLSAAMGKTEHALASLDAAFAAYSAERRSNPHVEIPIWGWNWGSEDHGGLKHPQDIDNILMDDYFSSQHLAPDTETSVDSLLSNQPSVRTKHERSILRTNLPANLGYEIPVQGRLHGGRSRPHGRGHLASYRQSLS